MDTNLENKIYELLLPIYIGNQDRKELSKEELDYYKNLIYEEILSNLYQVYYTLRNIQDIGSSLNLLNNVLYDLFKSNINKILYQNIYNNIIEDIKELLQPLIENIKEENNNNKLIQDYIDNIEYILNYFLNKEKIEEDLFNKIENIIENDKLIKLSNKEKISKLFHYYLKNSSKKKEEIENLEVLTELEEIIKELLNLDLKNHNKFEKLGFISTILLEEPNNFIKIYQKRKKEHQNKPKKEILNLFLKELENKYLITSKNKNTKYKLKNNYNIDRIIYFEEKKKIIFFDVTFNPNQKIDNDIYNQRIYQTIRHFFESISILNELKEQNIEIKDYHYRFLSNMKFLNLTNMKKSSFEQLNLFNKIFFENFLFNGLLTPIEEKLIYQLNKLKKEKSLSIKKSRMETFEFFKFGIKFLIEEFNKDKYKKEEKIDETLPLNKQLEKLIEKTDLEEARNFIKNNLKQEKIDILNIPYIKQLITKNIYQTLDGSSVKMNPISNLTKESIVLILSNSINLNYLTRNLILHSLKQDNYFNKLFPAIRKEKERENIEEILLKKKLSYLYNIFKEFNDKVKNITKQDIINLFGVKEKELNKIQKNYINNIYTKINYYQELLNNLEKDLELNIKKYDIENILDKKLKVLKIIGEINYLFIKYNENLKNFKESIGINQHILDTLFSRINNFFKYIEKKYKIEKLEEDKEKLEEDKKRLANEFKLKEKIENKLDDLFDNIMPNTQTIMTIMTIIQRIKKLKKSEDYLSYYKLIDKLLNNKIISIRQLLLDETLFNRLLNKEVQNKSIEELKIIFHIDFKRRLQELAKDLLEIPVDNYKESMIISLILNKTKENNIFQNYFENPKIQNVLKKLFEKKLSSKEQIKLLLLKDFLFQDKLLKLIKEKYNIKENELENFTLVLKKEQDKIVISLLPKDEIKDIQDNIKSNNIEIFDTNCYM